MHGQCHIADRILQKAGITDFGCTRSEPSLWRVSV
jgi:hypothetical protein